MQLLVGFRSFLGNAGFTTYSSCLALNSSMSLVIICCGLVPPGIPKVNFGCRKNTAVENMDALAAPAHTSEFLVSFPFTFYAVIGDTLKESS
ncbi:hypothetical protein OK016_29920 [Vibrio chagasii]|nr:hypothetical protein [Vibrio chagasii]